MKVVRDFVYIDESVTENYNQSGWLWAEKPHFDPVQSFRAHVLIHDVLEHHPDDGDGLEFELMALGATYFIRVFGRWSRFAAFGEFNGENAQYNDITYFAGLNKNQIDGCDEDIHEDLAEYFHRFKARFLTEYSYDVWLCTNLFRWVSKGYVRAKERWAPHTPTEVLIQLWEPLWKKFDSQDVDYQFRKQGARMQIAFDTVTLDHDITFDSSGIVLKPVESFVDNFKKIKIRYFV